MTLWIMNVEELQVEARKSFERFDGSQQDLAKLIRVNRAAISRAIRLTGLRHAAVQARIISQERNKPVQRRSTYEGATLRHEWVVGP